MIKDTLVTLLCMGNMQSISNFLERTVYIYNIYVCIYIYIYIYIHIFLLLFTSSSKCNFLLVSLFYHFLFYYVLSNQFILTGVFVCIVKETKNHKIK